MMIRTLGVALCALLAVACQGTNPGQVMPAGPSMAVSAGTSAATATAERMAGERPFKASLVWKATNVQWAGQPGVHKSLFGGRCSVESDYVITGSAYGEATHAGRITGETSHCSQITWSPQGPVGATYSDGRGVMDTANGSRLYMTYGSGTTGFDPGTAELWFRDNWTFTGGTGLFAGATGAGVEEGRFNDFMSLLGGAPVTMWMDGTVSYAPSGK